MTEERPNPAKLCFACGDENARGLHMHFSIANERAVAAFSVPDYMQGFPGQAHGGAVATMLDEAMGWAVYGQGIWAMTAKFTVRCPRQRPAWRGAIGGRLGDARPGALR